MEYIRSPKVAQIAQGVSKEPPTKKQLQKSVTK